ncbi:MAG: aspartate aminotransferase family protein [Flavobacteriales bacterium]|nr:aspartate aminotransferase family protein [Flavobacteriales bacterium]
MNLSESFYLHQAQTTDSPYAIEVESAEGIYIYDTSGKRYMDLISGVAVSNIGHRHPKVIEAIKEQLDKHLHVMVYGEYIQKPQAELAKKLTSLLPDSLDCLYPVNSGTEANEAALKLAKRITGRTEIISFNNSYHGNTHGSLSVTGNEQKKYRFRPLLPDVKFIAFNTISDLEEITIKTAAVIIEPIQGDSGLRIPSQGFMDALRNKCTETGTQLIFDEIQTGFGRTGSLFAFEHFNVVPDILTIAKGMGGGMPIGGVVSSKGKMRTLSNNPMLGHITTFGGHPVCCAAALANIQVIEEESLLSSVEEKGKLFSELLGKHSLVKEVRQIGLMLAIELENFEIVQKVVNGCLDKGVIGFWFISCNNSFRLAPPLTITEEEIKEGCAVIIEVMNKLLGDEL